jgi:hypothetical protein
MRNGSQHHPEIARWKPTPSHTEKENTLKPKNPIHAILDALAAQQRRGETSLTVRIELDLIQDAMNVGLQKALEFRRLADSGTEREPADR